MAPNCILSCPNLFIGGYNCLGVSLVGMEQAVAVIISAERENSVISHKHLRHYPES
ncbi:hypothetical protein GPZ83_0006845 [Serratia symbiotica]|nr:hypothetical protein [Serratia symbiotica]MBQ0956430.1 hypothetical protein [Serratia symbiotica]QTP15578.1 hypothetical protein GPZ83_0006845 [Serratia symbiotica]